MHGGDSAEAARALKKINIQLQGNVQSCLELACNYAACGAWDEVVELLSRNVDATPDKNHVNPMIYYYLAFACKQKGDADASRQYRELAGKMSRDYCFPFRVESIDVLRSAIAANPNDARAHYYLGNLLYNIQPLQAIAAWERSRQLEPKFATVHRNLGLAYTRVQRCYEKGVASLQDAFALNPGDPVVLAEFDQVAELAEVDPAERLAVFDKNAATSAKRDDARLAHVYLCVLMGQYDRALELLAERHFRRWEGEHGPHAMYVDAHLLRGHEFLAAGNIQEAEKHFLAALEYPDNFETGRPLKGGEKAAEIYWLLGVTAEAAGRPGEAKHRFEQVLTARRDLPEIRYYRALAMDKLGNKEAAEKMLDDLIHAGTEWINDLKTGPRFNFFAIFGGHPSVSKQTADAHYLIGLGYLGKGQLEKAAKELQEAVSWNMSHVSARTVLERLQKETSTVNRNVPSNTSAMGFAKDAIEQDNSLSSRP